MLMFIVFVLQHHDLINGGMNKHSNIQVSYQRKGATIKKIQKSICAQVN